jgi:hypothetical protein
MGFIFLNSVHLFHLDETPLLSFFIDSLSYHQKIIYDSSFIENETLIQSSLINGTTLY